MSEAGDVNWDEVRELATQVLGRGAPLVLTGEVRALLRRTAREVALDEAETEAALASVESATALLHKMRERIREGSNRLGDALHRMYRLRDQGDLDAARQQLRDVLAVEVVPLYREIAEDELEKLDGLT